MPGGFLQVIDWPDLKFGPVNLWTAPSPGVVQVLVLERERKILDRPNDLQERLSELLAQAQKHK